MTRDQMKKCVELTEQGWIEVNLPISDDTPIPGLILFIDSKQSKLLMVQPDGKAVNLLVALNFWKKVAEVYEERYGW